MTVCRDHIPLRSVYTVALIITADILTYGDLSCLWLAIALWWNWRYVNRLEQDLLLGNMETTQH